MTTMRHSYAIGLLIVLNVVIFGQTASFDFVDYDDRTYLSNNPQFEGGLTLENIQWSFTTGYFVNWHPVTWLSYFLDYEFYGMNPGGYHVTNVIIHILASILLYLALFKMTERRAESLIVAILFAIHPQHVQSVAWVSERKDVLSAFFMGLTLLAYHQYTQTKKYRWYGVTAFVYALGLMSKPMLVTLPCVLLLLDYWPLGRLGTRSEIRRAVLEKTPLLALAVGSSAITFLVQDSGGATVTLDSFGIVARIVNAIASYGMYLLRTIWPIDLTFIYPIHLDIIPYAAAAASSIALIGISIVAWIQRRTSPSLPVGWLWYLGTLVPVIGIFQVGQQTSADRYTYIPLIGVFIGVVYAMHPWLQRTVIRRKISRIGYVAALTICVFLSFKETYFWKDTATLAGRGILVRNDNHVALQLLGNVYLNEDDIVSAEHFFKKYRELKPNDINVLLHLASITRNQERYTESEELLLECIELHPDNPIGFFNLGILMGAQGRNDEAIQWYEKTLAFDELEVNFYVNYANLLSQTGSLELALEHYATAIELDPEDISPYHNRASALFYNGRDADAREAVLECLVHDPDYEPALLLLEAINGALEQKMDENLP